MSTTEKLLIPLIDDSITVNDVLSNKFIGVFTEDINLPGLDYIYLVFVYDMNDLHLSIKNCTDCVRRIGNNLFHILKFPKSSVDIKRILKGDYSLVSNEGISKIYNFWNNIDNEIANYPFGKTLAKESYYRCIPEETIIPLCKKESRGFVVRQHPRDLLFILMLAISDRTKLLFSFSLNSF